MLGAFCKQRNAGNQTETLSDKHEAGCCCSIVISLVCTMCLPHVMEHHTRCAYPEFECTDVQRLLYSADRTCTQAVMHLCCARKPYLEKHQCKEEQTIHHFVSLNLKGFMASNCRKGLWSHSSTHHTSCIATCWVLQQNQVYTTLGIISAYVVRLAPSHMHLAVNTKP